jgi:hypothetical protein
MGSVVGRTSMLPGATYAVPHGQTCDVHEDRLSTLRVQGETDSFGAELVDMCGECVGKWRAYRESPEARTGTCDWCKHTSNDLRTRRDADEGSSGPVYRVCGPCVKRDNEALAPASSEDSVYPDYEYSDLDVYDDSDSGF